MPEKVIVSTDGYTYLTQPELPHPLKVGTGNLVVNLFRADALSMGLLPPAVRWISHDRCSFLVERPAQVVNLMFTNKKAHAAKGAKDQEMISIPVPWTSHMIHFQTCHLHKLKSISLYARDAPIKTMDDELFELPLPNSMQRGVLCLGNSAQYYYNNLIEDVKTKRPLTAVDCINAALTLTWQAGFNTDIYINEDSLPAALKGVATEREANRTLKIMHAWEKHTKKEVDNWKWHSFKSPKVTVRTASQIDTIKKASVDSLTRLLRTNGLQK